MKQEYIFPEGFLWGAATSAYQTEGNNKNTDWWEWEQSKTTRRKYPLEKSGLACDSYHRYEEDFDLCQKLNNNAVRISVEWARIEPQKGEYSNREILHYKNVIEAANKRGLKVFLTLHHFTNPLWFSKLGGWANPLAPLYFKKYATKCAKEFGESVETIATINEPQVYALMGNITGDWPPNKKNPLISLITQINFIRAHNGAYKAIKKVGNFKVGIVKNIVWYYGERGIFKIFDRLIANTLNFFNNDFILRPMNQNSDFIGLNFYFTNKIKFFKIKNPNNFVSDMGWWIYPQGLEKVLLSLKKYKKPIYITENGCADSEDKIREKFIREMLISCHNAIKQGVTLKGYFHWSLLDNYEWHQGFWPRFGLVEIDRKNNLQRKPRRSFNYYATICRDNKVVT